MNSNATLKIPKSFGKPKQEISEQSKNSKNSTKNSKLDKNWKPDNWQESFYAKASNF